MPISTISRPFRMSSSVMVSRPTATVNASSSFSPNSAPSRHWVRRKRVMVCLTRAHSRGSLGSKTTHWVE